MVVAIRSANHSSGELKMGLPGKDGKTKQQNSVGFDEGSD
jgi:hypothetical protein